MAVFPSYDPIYGASKSSNSKRRIAKLGDGYESSTVFGLNRIRPEWKLQWIVEKEAAEQIEGFLQARSDAGETFEWQPPDSGFLQKWKCEEWVVSQETYGALKIDATFIRIFEMDAIELASVETQCPDDLCESDYGTNSPIGNWDVWVAKLRGSESSIGYQSASCMDEKGYVYYAFYYNEEVHLAKFTEGGANIWVKRYTDRGGSPQANYQLHIVSAIGEDRVIISQEANLLNNSVPWYPRQNGAMISVMAVDSVTGVLKWETAFSNGGFWRTSGSDCYFDGDFVEYPMVFLRYDPNLKLIIHSSRYYVQTVLSLSGDIVSQTGYAVNDVNIIPTNVGTGKLGTADYTLVQVNGSNPFVSLIPGHTTGFGTSGISVFSSVDTTSSGTIVRRAEFLGNGQVLVYGSSRGNSGYDELMIIGASGQIVDHVRLTTAAPRLSFSVNFPFNAGNVGGQYDLPGEPYWEINFVSSASKIYMTGSVGIGARTWEIDVTMSGSSIVSINGITNRRQMLSPSIYFSSTFWGAMRYSSPNPNYSRIVIAGGRRESPFTSITYTAALMGFKRNIDTLNQTISWSWNPSSPNTPTLSNPVEFSSDTSGFSVARDNLKLYTGSASLLYSLSRTMTEGFCLPGAIQSIYVINVPNTGTIDRTAELIFDLYTYKL